MAVNRPSPSKPTSKSSPSRKELSLEVCLNCGRSFRRFGDRKLLPCALCKSNFCDKCLLWDPDKRLFRCVKCRQKLKCGETIRNPPQGRKEAVCQTSKRKTVGINSLKRKLTSRHRVSVPDHQQSDVTTVELLTKGDDAANTIRERIESSVERILGSTLDQTSTVPNLVQPKSIKKLKLRTDLAPEEEWNDLLNYYCFYHDVNLFTKYHAWISNSVEKMAESMQFSVLDPIDKFSSVDEADLSRVVKDALEEAMVLSTKSNSSDDISRAFNELCVEDFNSQTYEDILATAVLNKVIDQCEKSLDHTTTEANQELAGTDTDSGLSGSIRGDTLKRPPQAVSRGPSEESLSPICRSPKTLPQFMVTTKMSGESPHSSVCSSDVGVGLEGNNESGNWNFETDSELPLQFKIEEHIEEITTHHLTDNQLDEESDANVSDSSEEDYLRSASCDSCPTSLQSGECAQPKRTIRKRHHQTRTAGPSEAVLPSLHLLPLSDPASITTNKVPFPEMGLDLIQETAADYSTMSEDTDPTHLILENTDWEENWLFRKLNKRKVSTQNVDPVSMLIPYPIARIGPTIGDRDIDELSELSERNSSCSYDAWSGAESDEDLEVNHDEASKELSDLVGEITNEFGQKDQEYTEHFSIIDRLQLNRKTSETFYGSHFDVVSPTKITVSSPVNSVKMLNSDRATNECNKSRSRKIQTQKCRKLLNPVPLPPPPNHVPKRISEELSSSATVWFENGPQNENIPSGRTLRLSCQVNARQSCGVSWFHNNTLINDTKTTFLWRKADLYHLDVFDMSEHRSGTYSVAAYTQKDCVWASCDVTCIDNDKALRIPRVTMSLTDLTVEAGNDVTLQCQVGGHPQPKVTFLHSGKPVVPSSHCLVENDQYGTWMLQFFEILATDEGQIKAVASNALGHAMTSCQLRVIPEGQIIPNFNNNVPVENSYHKVQSSKKISTAGKTSVSIGGNSTSDLSDPYSSDLNFLDKNVNRKAALYNEYVGRLEEPEESNDHEHFGLNGSLFQPPKPGTIAEREHRKWLDAKPLPNNPYSPEKLAYRLGKTSNLISRVGKCSGYRESSADESVDPSLRDGLPVLSDLSRYSRDYHVEREKQSRSLLPQTPPVLTADQANLSKHKAERSQSLGSNSLVRIQPQRSAQWKEELKDIQLDVGKKVADIQRTIDELQREWESRLSQKGWNSSPRYKSNLRNQRISSSCINLSCTPSSKRSSNLSVNNKRHLIYSSSEALNQGNQLRAADNNNIWRTGSVDTLNKNYRTTVYMSDDPRTHKLADHEAGARNANGSRMNSGVTSDSDDSFGTQRRKSANHSEGEKYQRSSGYNRKMRRYYSENSAESLIEESDTEESSLDTVDEMSNLPSVKELASKFDGPKRARNSNQSYRKNLKSFKSVENKNIIILEQRNQNGSFPGFANKKYDRKFVSNEVHHSLTARSVPRYFREGLRKQPTHPPASILEPLADENVRTSQNMDNVPPRNTPSPEHLGIPSSPALIPTRHYQSYPGDTSDDSVVATHMVPRRTHRRRAVKC